MFDQHQGLAFGVDSGAVQRVTGYDLDVDGEMFFKSGHFGGFARGLTAHNGAMFRCWVLK